MMATGDLKNNVKQLQAQLKTIKYIDKFDTEELVTGAPNVYLKIYHHLFTTYSTKFNKDINNSNNELYGKSDMRFMEAVYKILRDFFDYKPQITRHQFFAPGFAERKIIMATEVIRMIHMRYKPTKSVQTFKVLSPQEESIHQGKVQQEPIVHNNRKIASARQLEHLDNAIVLPLDRCGNQGFFVPKIVRNPKFGEAEKERKTDMKDGKSKQENVSNRSPSTPNSMPVSKNMKDEEAYTRNVEMALGKKITDLVEPAINFLSERIKKLDLTVEEMKSITQARETSKQEAQEMPVNESLMKLMNDVLFKLETLSSQVVLLENRMLIVEAAVNGTGQKSAQFQNRQSSVLGMESARSEGSPIPYRNQIDTKKLTQGVKDYSTIIKESTMNHEDISKKSKILEFIIGEHDQPLTTDCSNLDVTLNSEKTEIYNPNSQSFPNDSSPDSKPSVIDQAENFESQEPSPVDVTSNDALFYTRNEEIYEEPYDTASSDSDSHARESPHLLLDTSTLSKAERISQMMKETQQLLQ